MAYFSRVVARSLPRLHIYIYGVKLPTGIQIIAKRQQARRLPRLPGRMEHEILLLVNKTLHLFEVNPGKRVDVIMIGRDYRSGSIEKLGYFLHGAISLYNGAISLHTLKRYKGNTFLR